MSKSEFLPKLSKIAHNLSFEKYSPCHRTTEEVVIGTINPKAGCAGSVLNLLQVPEFNHQVEITKGVLEEDRSGMLRQFFCGTACKEEREVRHPEKYSFFVTFLHSDTCYR